MLFALNFLDGSQPLALINIRAYYLYFLWIIFQTPEQYSFRYVLSLSLSAMGFVARPTHVHALLLHVIFVCCCWSCIEFEGELTPSGGRGHSAQITGPVESLGATELASHAGIITLSCLDGGDSVRCGSTRSWERRRSRKEGGGSLSMISNALLEAIGFRDSFLDGRGFDPRSRCFVVVVLSTYTGWIKWFDLSTLR